MIGSSPKASRTAENNAIPGAEAQWPFLAVLSPAGISQKSEKPLK